MDDVLVHMEGISKAFPGVQALNQCRFELHRGEVHALVGENGAGKSTLMKILAGIYHPDAGTITLKEHPVHIPSPGAAQHLGICMIHQELNLMPHLTAAQNIFIGREPRRMWGLALDDAQINEKTQALFKRMHLDLDPRARVADLTVAKQQMVEIAKALSFNSEVLIMDEPTAALTESEIHELFRVIRDLRAKGVGLVYISHRLEELKQISDRITVMRDGSYVDTALTTEIPVERVISLMVGRTIYESAPELPEHPGDEVMLEVRGFNRGDEIKDINFTLKRGEILGFAGLMGAGRTEVARAIFGADPIDSGEIPLLEKAQAAGIPVIGFDSGVDSDIPATTAATDNLAAAALAADKMVELIGGSGEVAVIVHDQTSRTGIDRRDGFVKRIEEKYPDVTIVDIQYGGGDHLKSTDLAKAIIGAHPNIKGFFGANEGSIIGVLNAVKELGMEKKIVVIGYDSGQQQMDAVRSGVESGAITQDPIGIGYKCVEAAVKAINGETLPKTIDTGFHWYDASNIDAADIAPLLYK